MRKKSKLNRVSKSQKVFLTVFLIIFLIYGASLAYPFVWALMNAGKTGVEYVANPFGFAENYVWRNFLDAFVNLQYDGVSFLEMTWNSVWMTTLHVCANLGASVLVAYPMAKYHFPGKTALYSLVIMIQVFPVVNSGASSYVVLSNLGMLDNPWRFWLLWASGFDFAFVILYGYFKSVSWEYAEAAFMDGASDLKVFLKIMIPQARSSIGALFILQFVGAWGDYNTPLLYLKSYPNMALGIYLFKSESLFMANSMPLLFAAIIISALPILIMYACAKDTIMTNVTAGGLKG